MNAVPVSPCLFLGGVNVAAVFFRFDGAEWSADVEPNLWIDGSYLPCTDCADPAPHVAMQVTSLVCNFQDIRLQSRVGKRAIEHLLTRLGHNQHICGGCYRARANALCDEQ